MLSVFLPSPLPPPPTAFPRSGAVNGERRKQRFGSAALISTFIWKVANVRMFQEPGVNRGGPPTLYGRVSTEATRAHGTQLALIASANAFSLSFPPAGRRSSSHQEAPESTRNSLHSSFLRWKSSDNC